MHLSESSFFWVWSQILYGHLVKSRWCESPPSPSLWQTLRMEDIEVLVFYLFFGDHADHAILNAAREFRSAISHLPRLTCLELHNTSTQNLLQILVAKQPLPPSAISGSICQQHEDCKEESNSSPHKRPPLRWPSCTACIVCSTNLLTTVVKMAVRVPARLLRWGFQDFLK